MGKLRQKYIDEFMDKGDTADMLWEHTNVPTFEQNEASAVHFHYNMLFWCHKEVIYYYGVPSFLQKR